MISTAFLPRTIYMGGADQASAWLDHLTAAGHPEDNVLVLGEPGVFWVRSSWYN